MTNGVASAGMGPDLTRPASSVGRPGQGRDGSGRDDFSALMDGLNEKPAPAPETSGPTQEGDPAAPDEDDRPAEKESGDEERADPLLSGLQTGPILVTPKDPQELAPQPIGANPETELTEAEPALPSPSKLRPREAGEVTATEPAESGAEMVRDDQLGAWLRPMADSPEVSGDAQNRPAPKAGPWASPSERVLGALLRGPAEMTGLLSEAAGAALSGDPPREGFDGPGTPVAAREGRTSKDLAVQPGNRRAWLGSWAVPGALAAPAHERSQAGGLPNFLPKDGPSPNVATASSAADAVAKEPSASLAMVRSGTLKTPKTVPVAEDTASDAPSPKTSRFAGGEGEVPTSRPVLISAPAAIGRPRTTGNESALGSGMRVRDVVQLAGKKNQVSDALPPLVGWSMGTGALGAVPAQVTPPEAQRIARQVARHPVLRTGGSAEVSLAPVELGHLRLSVEMSEGGLRVVIEAARPETCDLMRRHVETLRQELRQEGLEAVSVSIGGRESRQGDGRSPGGRQDDAWTALGAGAATGGTGGLGPASSDPPVPRPARVAGHLDLRF